LLDIVAMSKKSGRSLNPNFHDGLKIQKVIEAIQNSNKKKRWISLDL